MTTDLCTRSRDALTADRIPSWVRQLVGGPADAPRTSTVSPAELAVVAQESWLYCSVRVPDARRLDSDAFRRVTASAYRALIEALRDHPGQRPVRMWNFIPGILDPTGDYRHRYMAFNAGRFEAFREWHDDGESLSRWVPTSSGVGNPNPDLVIHVLACDLPRTPLENPRQVSAYRYSPRYGPQPPCFSRAMRVEQNDLGSALLMLGGTASVVGEDTLHPHSLSAQIAETLRNLAALVGDGLRPRSDRSSPTGGLESVTQLRVYYVEDGHFAEIDRAVTSAFKGLCELDYVRTALCRDDLLVEMEGLARLAVGPRARVA